MRKHERKIRNQLRFSASQRPAQGAPRPGGALFFASSGGVYPASNCKPIHVYRRITQKGYRSWITPFSPEFAVRTVMRRNHHRRAFTLIEILLVVVILGILGALV